MTCAYCGETDGRKLHTVRDVLYQQGRTICVKPWDCLRRRITTWKKTREAS